MPIVRRCAIVIALTVTNNERTNMNANSNTNRNPQIFKVSKLFIGGLLDGITYIETLPFPMPVGLLVRKPCGGSPYKVTACEPA